MMDRQGNDLHPDLFRSETVSTEAKAQMGRIEQETPILIPRKLAQLEEVRESMRRNADPGRQPSSRATWRSVPAPHGEIPLRVLPVERPQGLLIHLHAGGWCAGAADMQDWLLEQYCERLRLTVVSIGYRLAPENPYPAAPDDCEAALLWIAGNCESEFATSRLLVLGESAGAHLAVTTLVRLRDLHGFAGFRGVCLAYGLYDLSGVPSHNAFDHRNLTLNSTLIEWFIDQFVPNLPRRDPDVSPLYADLAGLPPALITVGTHDPLRDQSLFLYTRWIAAANHARIVVCPGGLHGFLLLEPTPESRRIQAEVDGFMNEALRGTSPSF
jgi:acetyl esterase/lipase